MDRPERRVNPPEVQPAGSAVLGRGSGAGLGLTLAKAYAQVLGGQVGGRADEQGTVFWVKVPAPAAEGA